MSTHRGIRLRPKRPNPSVSLEDAVDYICWETESLMDHLVGSSSTIDLLQDDCKHGGKVLEAIRDCGWCIFFQHGNIGLEKLAEAVLANIDKVDRYEMKHIIEHSLSGVGDWLAHGDY